MARARTLAHGDERPSEAHGSDAFVLYRRRERDARPAFLLEVTPERLQLLLVRTSADGADVAAHRTLVRDRAVADDEVTFSLAQFQPQQPVAAQHRERVEAPAEG